MYEENRKKGINWKSLILKILILALIIFLIVWVVGLISNRNKDTNNKVFNQNINSMKEVAENYYKSNNLPENVGQKDKITLQQMIDDNLIMEFTDKNGSFCNEKDSYAQLTKTKEEKYQLKVLLSCDDNTDYIIKNMTIKNNQNDQDSQDDQIEEKENTDSKENTEKKDNKDNVNEENNDQKSVKEINKETNDVDEVDAKLEDSTTTNNNQKRTYMTYEKRKVYSYTTQYEFRKLVAASSISYTCPDGYSLMGDKCYKSIIETETDATVEYYDDEELVTVPLEKIEDSKKEYTDVITNVTDIIYSCPTGYTQTGTGENTKCYKNEITDKTHIDIANGSCPNGYTKKDDICVKYEKLVEINATKNCPNGYKVEGNNCVKYDNNSTINATKKCPAGYKVEGNNCVKYDNNSTINATKKTSYSYVNATKKTTYSYVNASKKTTYTTVNASKSYYCKYGTRSGSKCTYCPSGYNRSGNSCYKKVSQKSTTYGNWYVYTTKKSTTPLNAYSNKTEKMVYTGVTTQKTCSKCHTTRKYYNYTVYKRKNYIKTTYKKVYANLIYANTSVSYKCSKGTLNGTKCKIANTKYTCSKGTLNGTKCKIANTKYTCSKGTLNGTKCKIANTKYTCSKTNGIVSGSKCNYCPNGTKPVNGKCKVVSKLTYTCSKTNGVVSGTKCNYCPNGTKPVNGKCKVVSKLTYTCSKGTLNNTKCNYCPEGTELVNGKCQKEEKITYTCTDGSKPVDGKCYSCPNGYTENTKTGKCEKTDYTKVIKTGGEKTYSCPEGYMTEGNNENTKCYKLIDGKKTYYCEDKSFTLGSDNKCHKTVKGEIKGYTCPEGYALKDKKCYKTTDEQVEAFKNVTENKYDYTWSNNQTLDGWEFTGNTRTITNESEETIASPHTGIFDSNNLAKNIMLFGLLSMIVGYVSFFSIKKIRSRKSYIID